MNIKELRVYGKEILIKAEIEEASIDCDLLLEFVLEVSHQDLILNSETNVSEFKERLFKRFIDMRSARIPLAYITGEAWFYGYKFEVNKNCLIPRQETEILVENTLPLIKPGARILDLCTGSGCIAISLFLASKDIPEVSISASDISYKALNVAKNNAKKLGAKVDFYEGDMLLAISNVEEFDIITANPPYIQKAVIERLMPEVKDYEPRLALDGGEDGLNFYRRLAGSVLNHLKPGGYLVMEIGYDQALEVRNIFSVPEFKEFDVIKDYAGLDRVVIIKR